ncbi:MAG: hypothetical protein EOP88_10215 [Verrucomicrobiaceae bacterium]|nr:MAG: hypothetical protein EOP88_10215 [Verrucomicrobiaceae bacterium]
MEVDIVSIALARFVKYGTDTGQLQEFVIFLKGAGISQERMLEMLEASRGSAPDSNNEDAILDVMDYVCGYCREDMRIY